MPVKKANNKRAGKKHTTASRERSLLTKEDGQEYGVCLKLLGGSHIKVACYDGVERIGVIRGTMRGKKKSKAFISEGCHLLVALREFVEAKPKCDVIHIYNPDEVKRLKESGELIETNLNADLSRFENMAMQQQESDEPFCFEEI